MGIRKLKPQTITPSTSDVTVRDDGINKLVTVLGDADLVAGNILTGKNLFGIDGNLIQGKRWNSGTATSSNLTYTENSSGSGFLKYERKYSLGISGLDFKPSYIFGRASYDNKDIMFMFYQNTAFYYVHATSSGSSVGSYMLSGFDEASTSVSTSLGSFNIPIFEIFDQYGFQAFSPTSIYWFAFE